MIENELIIIVNKLPNETLQTIFSYLNPRSLMACRAVCWRWCYNVDYVTEKDILWRKFCEKDYGDICHSAYRCSNGLKWFQIYKSLTIWDKLIHVQETMQEFSTMKNNRERIKNFQLINNGIIGILKENSVVYYSSDTLEKRQELTIGGNYSVYKENCNIVLQLSKRDRLILMTKGNNKEIKLMIYKVKLFLMLDNIIYYVTSTNHLQKCTFVDGIYININLVQVPNKVLALGYENSILYILTFNDIIYSLMNDELVVVYHHVSIREKFEALRRYNFTKTVWAKVYKPMRFFYESRQEFPQVKNLLVLQTHGPVMFAGYRRGILRIFYSLYNTTVLDLLKSKPIKKIYLLNYHESTIMSTILNIDVIEGADCHTVIVAMPKKMIAIKFTHTLSTKEASSGHVKQSPKRESLSPIDENLSTSHEKISFSHENLSISREKLSNSSGDQ